jgi:hypothetical protein
MEDHETRRKIIRQWRSLPKDKRQTAEQAAVFAKKALEENQLQPSRRDIKGLWVGCCHASASDRSDRFIDPSLTMYKGKDRK